MEEFKTRLIEEENQLNDRLVKLTRFFSSPEINKLSEHQKSLLLNQHKVMELYLDILRMRLQSIGKL